MLNHYVFDIFAKHHPLRESPSGKEWARDKHCVRVVHNNRSASAQDCWVYVCVVPESYNNKLITILRYYGAIMCQIILLRPYRTHGDCYADCYGMLSGWRDYASWLAVLDTLWEVGNLWGLVGSDTFWKQYRRFSCRRQ